MRLAWKAGCVGTGYHNRKTLRVSKRRVDGRCGRGAFTECAAFPGASQGVIALAYAVVVPWALGLAQVYISIFRTCKGPEIPVCS